MENKEKTELSENEYKENIDKVKKQIKILTILVVTLCLIAVICIRNYYNSIVNGTILKPIIYISRRKNANNHKAWKTRKINMYIS